MFYDEMLYKIVQNYLHQLYHNILNQMHVKYYNEFQRKTNMEFVKRIPNTIYILVYLHMIQQSLYHRILSYI